MGIDGGGARGVQGCLKRKWEDSAASVAATWGKKSGGKGEGKARMGIAATAPTAAMLDAQGWICIWGFLSRGGRVCEGVAPGERNVICGTQSKGAAALRRAGTQRNARNTPSTPRPPQRTHRV